MPAIPRRGSTPPFRARTPDGGDPWAESRPAPTLANIALPPRRRLRDGTTSSASSRRESASSRGSRASVPRGTKRARSGSTPSEEPNAEQSRRLPRLRARARVLVPHSSEEESDDEGMNGEDDANGEESPRSPQSVHSASAEPRRFTAAEKGKGRAQPSATATPEVFEIDSDSDEIVPLADESIQFISSAPAAKVEVPEVEEEASVIDDDSAITAFMCFCAATAPALTPCGHIMCYSCLHSSLLASIGRNTNPWPRGRPSRGRPRGRGRGRTTRGRQTDLSQPSEWQQDAITEAFTDDLDSTLRATLAESGTVGADADAIIAASHEGREMQVEHPLNGLWKVEGKWVIEGECPVCRKPIPGGLGPLGSSVGGVILLETRVAYPGEGPPTAIAAA